MKEDVLNLLKEVLPQIDFTASERLVDDGILDSISIITLVSELSAEYDIEFDLAQLKPENLNSIDAIVNTIQSLQNK